MDLHRMQDAPSAAEVAAVDAALDAALGPPARARTGVRSGAELRVSERRRDAARGRRQLLLPALWAVQRAAGWISAGALGYVCERLEVPPAEAFGVADSYALLSTQPRPPRVTHVCDDIVCRGSGAEALCAELERALGPAGTGEAETDPETWQRSPCLGLCERAPAAFVQSAGEADRVLAPAVLDADAGRLTGEPAARSAAEAAPQTGEPRDAGLRLLRRVGAVDPASLDDYRAHGGYAALRLARELGPERVIRELEEAALLGRGGAAFPAGRKWADVARAPARPRYVVCNADESEPGTFKDRVLMELDPFAVIEAMTIAGFVTGAELGYLYVRGEYPLAAARLEAAITQARTHALLGDDVMGAGFRFDIELRRGAGAYICGEETALFNSIEGFRGEPRSKPPFPTQAGLFGKPTLVNNVETLVNVLDIVREGGTAYAAIGTGGSDGSTGTKLFCVAGSVARPGVYEVPFGTTLGALLELAGGTPAGGIAAILLGGTAGSFVTAEQLDLPLTFEDARRAGVSLGSGAVTVFDGSADLAGTVLRIAAFFRDESCGQCVPCRVGTVRQEEALHRFARSADPASTAAELALLDDIAVVMTDASICGLGQTAGSAVRSALALDLLAAGRRVT